MPAADVSVRVPRKRSELYRSAHRVARFQFVRAFEGGHLAADCDPGLGVAWSQIRSAIAEVVLELEGRAMAAKAVEYALERRGFFCSRAWENAHTAPGVESVPPEHGKQDSAMGRTNGVNRRGSK